MMKLHITENGIGKLNMHILMESHRLLFFDGTQHSSQRESEEHLCRFFLYILPRGIFLSGCRFYRWNPQGF